MATTVAQPLFPVTVFAHTVDQPDALNRKLEKRVRAIAEAHPLWMGKASPWQCAPDLHTQPGFRPLVDAVDEGMRAVVSAMQYDVEGWSITGMWANWLHPGEVHPPHSHPNNAWSGVYYIRSNAEEEAPITFFHPARAADVLRPRVKGWTVGNATTWQMPATEGTMYLFPAWLMHWVPPVRADRISVAFNLQWRGELGDRDAFAWSRVS